MEQLIASPKAPFYRMSTRDRQLIAERVIKGTDGMILWAKLVLEEMAKQKTLLQVQKCLDTAPHEFNNHLYANILDNLDKENSGTLRIFQWLLCVQGPLDVNELEEILNLDITSRQLRVPFLHHSVREWFLSTESLGLYLSSCHKEVGITISLLLSSLHFAHRTITRTPSLSLEPNHDHLLDWEILPQPSRSCSMRYSPGLYTSSTLPPTTKAPF
jgi:hypothetical protein